MSSLGNGHQDVDIDLAQLFRAVWSRKGTILVSGPAMVFSQIAHMAKNSTDGRSEAVNDAK